MKFRKEIALKGVNGQKMAVNCTLNDRGDWVVSLSRWDVRNEYWTFYTIWDEYGSTAPRVVPVENRAEHFRKPMLAKYLEGFDVEAFKMECWESIKP